MGQSRNHRACSRTTLGFVVLLLVPLGPSKAMAQDDSVTAGCQDLAGADRSVIELKTMMQPGPSDDSRRFAIVIGNDYPGQKLPDGKYQRASDAVPVLKNGSNDAKAMANIFRSHQFWTACFLNVTANVNEAILTAALDIGDKKTNGLTLYYFAGHGFALGEQTYSVGDGAKLLSAETLVRYSLDVSDIVSFLHSREAPVVAIFDMCREKMIPKTSGAGRALANQPLAGAAPFTIEKGMIIQYSTKPNDIANDMPALKNGLYAKVFLDHMPSAPGLSVEVLLTDKVGTDVAKGLQIGGTWYRQIPTAYAYPQDWSKIALFDVAKSPYLDQAMQKLQVIDGWIDSGSISTMPDIVCKFIADIRVPASTSPEHPTGAHFSATEVLQYIDRLQVKMTGAGYSCQQIEAKAETQPAPDGTEAFTVPPIVHVAAKSVVAKTVGYDANLIKFTDGSIKKGSWLATNSTPFEIGSTSEGRYVVEKTAQADLSVGFTTPVVGSVQVNAKEPAVFSIPINSSNVTPVVTKDQVLFRFGATSPNLDELERTRKDLAILKRSSPDSRLLLILPPVNGDGGLEKARLRTLRVISVLAELNQEGIPLQRIIIPPDTQSQLIKLSSLDQNQMLLKVVVKNQSYLDQLTPDALRSSYHAPLSNSALVMYKYKASIGKLRPLD
jgi:hypothetical protein